MLAIFLYSSLGTTWWWPLLETGYWVRWAVSLVIYTRYTERELQQCVLWLGDLPYSLALKLRQCSSGGTGKGSAWQRAQETVVYGQKDRSVDA